MTSDLSDVIRFISDRISDYEKPEYMSKWADKAMKELPSRRYALSSRDSKRKRWKRKSKSISDRIKWVLNKVEKLEDFSLMEKLQLAFIFSRPVSDEFVQLLKDAKFKIEQDKKKRIRRFSTEDESIIRFSDHEARVKYFQGVLCRTSTIQKNKNLERMSRQKKQSQQAVANETPSPEVSAATNEYFVIRYISDRISDYEKPEGFTKWCQKAMKGVSPRSFSCMRASVRDKLGRIEKLDGFSLMEKLQLVFIFSRSVSDEFVQILKDAKFEIEQDERNRICRFLTEDGSIVRFSDHHPNVKYFEGVLCLNSNLQKNANKERIEREKEHGQQDLSYEIPSSEVPLITEQPVESIPIEPKREEIDEEVKEKPVKDDPIEKKPKQETDDYIDFGVDAGQAFNGRINYEELDAQKFFFPGFPGEMKPETSIGSQKKHQNSTTDSEKRVKIEEMESGALSADSIATSSDKKQQSSQEATPAIPTPDEPKVTHLLMDTGFYNQLE